MTELSKQENEKGKKIVEGPTIYLWVLSVVTGIGLFSLNFGGWMGNDINIGPVSIGLPSPNTSWVLLGLFVAALVGLYVRKNWAVPVGRAALVVSMIIFFPVGTIFGAILWKRYNDPEAKKYLNYIETEKSEEAPAGAETGKTEDQGKENKEENN
ncbi:MAG: hypothetical protein JW997_01485 [Actinobacteria bacterium]|nr:hypothetical protein [Actinomycetota bacterium]